MTIALLIPANNARAQAGERCFPETGFCIAGRIRTYWEQNGGLPVFGFPIGPQQAEIDRGPGLPGPVVRARPPGATPREPAAL